MADNVKYVAMFKKTKHSLDTNDGEWANWSKIKVVNSLYVVMMCKNLIKRCVLLYTKVGGLVMFG